MHIFRFFHPFGTRVGVAVDGDRFDLSAAGPAFATIASWLSLPDPIGALERAIPIARDFAITESVELAPPLDEQEVWASGATYLRAKDARTGESNGGGDFYDKVYHAERPDLFFKSMPHRVVGHGQKVRVRKDSDWDVPEPELALVLSSAGNIVGYTIGNDMSSRSIEGENPLYLTQARVYDGSCALGPVIAVHDGETAVRKIRMTIMRGRGTIFEGETSTDQICRPLTELAEYLFREMTFSKGVFLLTGTGIVPPEDLTLRQGDVVRIMIDGIGILENQVA